MRKQSGGNLFSALLSLTRTALPPILKTLGLPALSGAVSLQALKKLLEEKVPDVQAEVGYSLFHKIR